MVVKRAPFERPKSYFATQESRKPQSSPTKESRTVVARQPTKSFTPSRLDKQASNTISAARRAPEARASARSRTPSPVAHTSTSEGPSSRRRNVDHLKSRLESTLHAEDDVESDDEPMPPPKKRPSLGGFSPPKPLFIPQGPKDNIDTMLLKGKPDGIKPSSFYKSSRSLSTLGSSQSQKWKSMSFPSTTGASPPLARARPSASEAFKARYDGTSHRLHSQPSPAPRRGGGFKNMGNTCYVNAVVQALMALPSFSYMLKAMPDTIESDDDDDEDEQNDAYTLVIGDDSPAGSADGKRPKKFTKARPVITALRTVADRLKLRSQGAQESIDISPVQKALAKTAQHFRNNQQQDAHEFMTFLFDRFQAEQGECAERDCPIAANFACEVAHRRTCTGCKATTPPIKESYLNFSLDIPSRTADGKAPSLLYLLEHFFENEEVEYKCESDACDSEISALSHRISQLPRILVLTLKRFAYDADLGRQHKRSHPVDIPTLINIANVTDDNCRAPTATAGIPLFGTAPQRASDSADVSENSQRRLTFGGKDVSKPTVAELLQDEDLALQHALEESRREASEASELEQYTTPSKETLIAATTSPHGGMKKSSVTPGFSPCARGKYQGVGSPDTEYCLISVVLHHGSTGHSGHYVSNIYDAKKGSWTKFNDSLVTQRTEDDVLREASNGSYMLFYAHRSLFQ